MSNLFFCGISERLDRLFHGTPDLPDTERLAQLTNWILNQGNLFAALPVVHLPSAQGLNAD